MILELGTLYTIIVCCAVYVRNTRLLCISVITLFILQVHRSCKIPSNIMVDLFVIESRPVLQTCQQFSVSHSWYYVSANKMTYLFTLQMKNFGECDETKKVANQRINSIRDTKVFMRTVFIPPPVLY